MHNCPNCGCSLKQFEPVTFGNVEIDTRGNIVFLGQEVLMSKTQRLVAEALIRARGRRLSIGVLASILGGEIEDKSVVQYIQRTRAAFREIDPGFDQIEVDYGASCYRWRQVPMLPIARGGAQAVGPGSYAVN